MALLYLTIWLSVVLFVIGEAGRVQPGATRPWAWWVFTAGLVLAVVHTLLAFALVHHWSHADAVGATAAQTAAVYGVAFGGGVYVNYLFFGVWAADAWWWRMTAPEQRPRWAAWTLRVFYLVILVNAAVVFAAGARRIAGAMLVGLLLWLWTRGRFALPDGVRS